MVKVVQDFDKLFTMYKFVNFKIFKISLIFSFFINLFLFSISLLSKDYEMIMSIGIFCLIGFVVLIFCILKFKEIQTKESFIIIINLFIKGEKTINQYDIKKIRKSSIYFFPFTNVIHYEENGIKKWFLFFGEIN